ncbi:DNA-protecting protein DprA [Candidatus Microgenomates bacterium]|nr:DNA-protecting protein DprA [Candidatus Microgenomates bacterium]
MTEREALIALCAFVPFGPARIKLFLEYFGSARETWKAETRRFKEIGVSDKLVSEFSEWRRHFDFSSYFAKLVKFGVSVATVTDKNYPERLRQTDDAPIVLYIKGELKNVDVSVAIVGSRKITSYGREVAEKISSELAAAGVTIISGLALGVDGVAHRAALEVGGRTIAILGNGLDQIYPPSHRELAQKVTKHGALVSEYPLGHSALPMNFPYRNRIISGMSLGVVVIEGTEKSGTLLTASHAARQGREVFAVPGPITSPNAAAPNLLIKQGAKVVTGVEDILEELDLGHRAKGIMNREILPETEEEKLIFQLIENEPLHIDEIVRRVRFDAGIVLSTLTTMELKGMVKDIGGNIYQVIAI